MNYKFKIDNITGFPEHNGLTNVIATVYWSIAFENNGGNSLAGGETVLNLSNIDPATYIAVQDVSEQQIIDWVLAIEGGQEFIDKLWSIHEKFCEEDAFKKNQQPISTSFLTASDPVVEKITLDPI